MPRRILIVEDDTNFQQIVAMRLTAWDSDCEIVYATRIDQARAVLADENQGFSLVILDQHLPDGMGNELFDHPALQNTTVLAVSSDDTPELPGAAVKAGAHHFLGKRQVSTPLFIPLIEALIERRRLEREFRAMELTASRLETIRILLRTLRHEINNPLGAVLGGAYLVRTAGGLDEDQQRALRLIEQSGNRIKHVLEQLCDTAELETVTKGHEQVFQVPGDPSWETPQAKKAETAEASSARDVAENKKEK